MPESELILTFGSRSGSWVALALFGALFGLLALIVARGIRYAVVPR